MYLFNKDFSSDIFRQNKSLIFLLIAGLLINAGMIYVLFSTKTFNTRDIFGFSNPLLILLYVCALSYFLSKNKDYSEYLLRVYSTIVVIFSIVSCCVFLYKYLHGQSFLVSNFYTGYSGGSIIQSIVALTFPFTAVYLILKTKKIDYKIFKLALYLSSILIIFVDLFVNRSKVGYIIEFVVLIYYVLVLVKYYGNRVSNSNIKKTALTLIAGLLLITVLFSIAFKQSNIFNTRVSQMFKEITLFFDKNVDEEKINQLSHSSTGLRLMYYDSSVKVFKAYPSILLFGCPFTQKTYSVTECSGELISNNSELSRDSYVVDEIMPHDEFINYTFRGGILAGICLLAFFIALFYEARKLSVDDKVCLRVLTIAIFIGSCFDYFMTTQMIVILFSTILAIFLSKQKTIY
jgi:hypothetical protein